MMRFFNLLISRLEVRVLRGSLWSWATSWLGKDLKAEARLRPTSWLRKILTGRPQWKMKQNHNGIGLNDLVDGFLFSIQADGRAPRTHQYYKKLLKHLLRYARNQSWPDRLGIIDITRLRQFLSWVSIRTYEYIAGNGSIRLIKPNSSAAWPYYKALRRLFNWAVEEGLLSQNPMATSLQSTSLCTNTALCCRWTEKNPCGVCLDINTRAVFTGIRNKAMLLLFLDAGLRLKEITELRFRDLNLDQRCVRIIGKGNKPDICPFSARTAKVI